MTKNKELIDELKEEVLKSPYADGSMTAREDRLVDVGITLALSSANKENLKVINNLIKDYNGKLKAREVIIERANKEIEELKESRDGWKQLRETLDILYEEQKKKLQTAEKDVTELKAKNSYLLDLLKKHQIKIS